MIPTPNFRKWASVKAGPRSFSDSSSDDQTPHFKGNPNYVEIDGPHGKRWHLAHPKPELLKEHLDKAENRGAEFKVFGWERQDWDGSEWGDIGKDASEGFSEITGCANGREWVKRLTAGIPIDFDDGGTVRFRIESIESPYNDPAEDVIWQAERFGWDVERDGGRLTRSMIVDSDDEDETDPDDYDVEQETYNYRTGEWQSENVSDFEATPHPRYVLSITHPEMGKMVRSIYHDPDSGEKVAYQALWKAGEASGNGLSSYFYQSQMEAYSTAGVDVVKVHANIDVGGYAWARHGFDLDDAYGEDDLDDYTDAVEESLKTKINDLESTHDLSATLDRISDPFLHDVDEDDPDDDTLLGIARADGLHSGMSREEFHREAVAQGWRGRSMHNRIEALYDYIDTDDSPESIAKASLERHGLQVDDFDTPRQVLDRFRGYEYIGGTPEDWERYDEARRHEDDPVPPGRRRYDDAEIGSIVQGWHNLKYGKDGKGGKLGDRVVSHQYESVLSQVRNASDMPALASITYPKELAEAIGEKAGESVAKETLLGSSWHGKQSIGIHSAYDADGNMYRASKIKKMIHDPSKTATPEGAVGKMSNTDWDTASPSDAWNHLMPQGVSPDKVAGPHEIIQAINQRVEANEVDKPPFAAAQMAMDYYRQQRRGEAKRQGISPKELRRSPELWATQMDDAPPSLFSTPQQFNEHLATVSPSLQKPNKDALYDHWDAETNAAHLGIQHHALPSPGEPVSPATHQYREVRHLLRDTSLSRAALPDELPPMLDKMHEANPQMSPQDIFKALEYWSGGETTGPKRAKQVTPVVKAVIGSAPFAMGDIDHDNPEPLREHFTDFYKNVLATGHGLPESERIPEYYDKAIPIAQRILSHVRQGRKK